ncbi:MAG TPA: hypothetical protein ENH75_10035 [archaeon]|nr:hypothetical protein [archaeon]
MNEIDKIEKYRGILKTGYSDPVWNYSTTGNGVNQVAISSDGKYVAVIRSNIGGLLLFNKSNPIPLWSHSDGIFGDGGHGLDISSDGNYIVAASGSNPRFNVYKKSSPIPLWSFLAEDEVRTVAISSDGNYIVAGAGFGWSFSTQYSTNKVYLFNTSSSIPLWEYTTNSNVRDVAISSTGDYIAAASTSDKYQVHFFNKNNSTPIWSYNLSGALSDIELSSDGKYLIIGDGYNIYLFDTSSSIPLWSYNAGENFVSFDISLDGKKFFAGSSHALYLFNTSSSTPIWIKDSISSGINTVAISSDGNYATAAGIYYLYFFNSSNSNPLWAHTITGTGVDYIDISSKGNYIVAGGRNDGIIYFFNSLIPDAFTLTSDTQEIDDDGKFNLAWEEVGLANNYTIYTYQNYITKINNSVTILQQGLTTNNYSISGLANGTYYFKIAAINNYGKSYSNCLRIEVLLYPPKEFNFYTLSDDPDEDGVVLLRWGSSEFAQNYSLFFSNNSETGCNGPYNKVAEGMTNNSYLLSDLQSGIYYLKVIAYNQFGSASSNCLEIHVELPTPENAIPGYSLILMLILLSAILEIFYITKIRKKIH